jgi:hypothetical protein
MFREIIHAPPARAEKMVHVVILAPMYVAGQACEVGAKVTMSDSDARALRNSMPPSVEIL